jgi:hypothetical protein
MQLAQSRVKKNPTREKMQLVSFMQLNTFYKELQKINKPSTFKRLSTELRHDASELLLDNRFIGTSNYATH